MKIPGWLSLIPQQWFFKSWCLTIFQVRGGGGGRGRSGDHLRRSLIGKSLMVVSGLNRGRGGRRGRNVLIELLIISLLVHHNNIDKNNKNNSVSELRRTTPVQPWPRRWWLSTTEPRRYYWGQNTTPTPLTSGPWDASSENFWDGEYCSR